MSDLPPDMAYWLDRKYDNLEKKAGMKDGLRGGAMGGPAGGGISPPRPSNSPASGGIQALGQPQSTLPAGMADALDRKYGIDEFKAEQEQKAKNPNAEVTGMPRNFNMWRMAGPGSGNAVADAWQMNAMNAFQSAADASRKSVGFADGTEDVTMNGLRMNTGSAEVMQKGKTKVVDKEGNGHPRVDTVPAILAEGEAVLNAAAAERMGRDNIKQLNQQGLRDMDMDDKARPVMKKGGRLGAFTGVEMAVPKAAMASFAKGTDFARTSPENDAEYHPTEYSEPRDPEHDAEHMAQPLSGGGQGFSLRSGTAKVMNVKGYVAGVANVPGETETELTNFDKQRDRNQLNEAMPYGVPALGEPAGEAGAVTPSREVARMRQNYGLTAQGFANGTEDVQAKQPAQIPGVVYAADGDESILNRAKDLGSRAVSGLRGMFGGGAEVAAGSADDVAAAARLAEEAAAKEAAAAQAARVAQTQAAEVAATKAVPAAAPATSSAAESIAAKQAAATQAARTAMGEGAATASQGLRGGAGMSAPAAAAPAAAAAAPAAAAPAAAAPAVPAGYAAGQAVGKAAAGLRSAGLGAVPVIGGALTAGQALSEMPAGFFNDPNVPMVEKAAQAARSFGRAALPYAGGAIGSGVAPILGTAAGAGLGLAAASQIDAEGKALRDWRVAQPKVAPTTTAPAAPAAPAAARVGAPAAAAAPAAARVGAPGAGGAGGVTQTGLRGATKGAGKSDEEVFGIPIIRGVKTFYDDFDFQNASPQQLRAHLTSETMQGSKPAEGILKDLTDRETEAARLSDKAIDRAASAALKAAGGGGKKGLQDAKFFDDPVLDPKTGRIVAGQERKDLNETFDGQYLPQYAARLGKRPNQLEPTEQAKALVSFDLNRAAQNYALKSGKGFNFKMPVDVNNIQYVDDLPMLSRIVGRARGESTWKEGFWDNGGIVITDGLEKQELPIDFLEESGALANPAMSQLVKTLKARNGKK